MHEDAWGAHGHSVEGVTKGAECPGGQSALGGPVRLALGQIMGFVQIIVEHSYCE